MSEVGWHLARSGHHVTREARIGGVAHVDLGVDGTAVEFKSAFAMWALTADDAERKKWFGPDIDKLRQSTTPAVMVITVAGLGVGVTHQKAGYKVTHPTSAHHIGDSSPTELLDQALEVYARFLSHQADSPARTVQLGAAPLLDGPEVVLLAAVLASIHRN